VLFDLDGVLVDSRGLIESVWRAWAARRGLDPAPFLLVAHGRRTSETLRDVAPSLDLPAATAELDALEERTTTGLVAAPGAAALLAALPQDRWAIVTSGSRAVATRRLRAAGLPVPAVLVTGDAVPRGKPDPAGYLAAADALGFAPQECVVLEDAPPGIAAATAAGMHVVTVAADLTGVRIAHDPATGGLLLVG
jgi:sugar-phosphatase